MFKVIVAIIRDSDAAAVTDALIAGNFRATRIASTGAFFRQGNTTLIVGVEADKVDAVIETLKASCRPAPPDGSHRATIFVLNAARFEQI
jgi:uncharacterized protein YaaQ